MEVWLAAGAPVGPPLQNPTAQFAPPGAQNPPTAQFGFPGAQSFNPSVPNPAISPPKSGVVCTVPNLSITC
jgi:hypothetical protein